MHHIVQVNPILMPREPLQEDESWGMGDRGLPAGAVDGASGLHLLCRDEDSAGGVHSAVTSACTAVCPVSGMHCSVPCVCSQAVQACTAARPQGHQV